MRSLKRAKVAYRWCLAFLIVMVIGVYAALVDHTAAWDDSLIYLVGAKSLAEGHGYRLISAPPPAPVPKFPPLLSVVLSALWRMAPEYPANLPLLKVVGIVSAIIFAIIAAAILRRVGRPAGLVLAAVAMLLLNTDVTQQVGSTVFADLPFTALAALGLYLLEVDTQQRRVEWVTLGLGLTIAASILTRVIGVVLFIVAVGYLCWQRTFAKAALVLMLGSLAVAWFAMQSLPSSTPPKRVWPNGGLSSYLEIYRYAGVSGDGRRERSLAEIGGMVVQQQGAMLKFLLQQGLAIGRAGFGFDLLKERKPSVSPWRDWAVILLGVIFAGLTLAGAIFDWHKHPSVLHVFMVVYYLAAAATPWGPSFLRRYLLPVGIFLNYFFLLGVTQIVLFVWKRLVLSQKGMPQRAGSCLAQAVALGTAVVLVMPNLAFTTRHIFNLHAPGGPRGNYYATESQRHDAYRWIQEHVSSGEVIAAHYAGEVYLVTGRHSVPFVGASIRELPDEGVRWILTGPEDGYKGDISAILNAEGATMQWSSDSGKFAIYLLRKP